MIRLRGGDPTVGDGMTIAGRNFGPILGYALIAATVGVMLQTASRKSSGPGTHDRLAGRHVLDHRHLPGGAHPGGRRRGTHRGDQAQRAYLKRTWGEQIAGNIGLGAIFGLAFLVIFLAFAPVFFLIFTAGTVNVWLLGGLWSWCSCWSCLLGWCAPTVEGIYSAAVYQYAVDGQPSGFFDEDLVRNAFRSR